MPLDKAGVAAALDANIDTIRTYVEDDGDLIERYQEAFRNLPTMGTAEELQSELSCLVLPPIERHFRRSPGKIPSR